MTRLDDLGRSWLRRGYQNPTPTWGLSVPDLMAETPVTFYRAGTAVLDDYGSFTGNVPQLLWSTNAHVVIEELRGAIESQELLEGTVGKYIYRIYAAFPPQPELRPIVGDTVEFVDPFGVTKRLVVKHDFSHDGLKDHIEIATEVFD